MRANILRHKLFLFWLSCSSFISTHLIVKGSLVGGSLLHARICFLRTSSKFLLARRYTQHRQLLKSSIYGDDSNEGDYLENESDAHVTLDMGQ